MGAGKGFTLIELIVVIIIVGVIAAIAIPNFFNSMEQTKAQAAKNNLLAISSAEEKYDEDHGSVGTYCLAGCADNVPEIDQYLSLSIPSNDPFTYQCVTGAPYTCTAIDYTYTPNVILFTTGTVVRCTQGGSACPS